MTLLTVTRTHIAPIGLLLIASALLVACTANSTGAPVAEAAPAPQPITQQQASEECWMDTEHGAKSLPLDKRAKLVDKCVKDKMSGAK